MNYDDISKHIILTNVSNYYVSDENCENLFYKAMVNNVNGVMIGPSSLQHIKKFDDLVKTIVAISYPSGGEHPDLKERAIINCENINDSVFAYFVTASVGYFMSGHKDYLEEEMRRCVEAVRKPIYFIIETSQIEDKHLETLCKSAIEVGVKGVVNCTAFDPYGFENNTVEDVIRLKKYADDRLEVVAAGQLDSMKKVEEVLKAGADKAVINKFTDILKL